MKNRTTLIAAGLLLSACGESSSEAHVPSFPLFDAAALQETCGARLTEYLDEGPKGRKSEIPPEIDWAPDIYAAIERAKAEDKPIFMASSVRQYANLDQDPNCDL